MLSGKLLLLLKNGYYLIFSYLLVFYKTFLWLILPNLMLSYFIVNCRLNFVNKVGQVFQKIVYFHFILSPFPQQWPYPYLFCSWNSPKDNGLRWQMGR